MKLIDGNITNNFKLSEIACNDADQTIILNSDIIKHIENIQTFRAWFNRSMKVTSWYRTPTYNKKVGGSSSSKHMKGIATDFLLPSDFKGFSTERKNEFIENCRAKWHEINGGKGGFGTYDTFIHMDSRDSLVDFDYRKNKSW